MKTLAALLLSVAAVAAHADGDPRPITHPPGQFVRVNGAKLWVESEGEGDPVVLIAGGPGCSHAYFHPFFSDLAAHHRVIYFDSLGRGKSDKAKTVSAYTLERDVADVEGLRRALKLGRITVLGQSYGGVVAQAYAIAHPDAVAKLVLSNTLFDAEMWQAGNDVINAEIRNQFPELWAKIQALRDQGVQSGDKEMGVAFGDDYPYGVAFFYNPDNEKKVAFETNVDVLYQITGRDGDFLVTSDMGRFDFRRDLAKLPMPTLIVAGRYDRAIPPRWSLEYKRWMPQARFAMFERSGHHPEIEEQAEYFHLLEDFLGP